MSNKQFRKNKKQKKEIEDIKKEIDTNDATYKRSKEHLDAIIHLNLIRNRILQENSPFFLTVIKQLKFENDELILQVKSEFRVISPTFEFQRNIEWQRLQTSFCKEKLETNKKLLEDLEQAIFKIKEDITLQQTRWYDRRKLLIERLKELNEDVSGFETPSYIG